MNRGRMRRKTPPAMITVIFIVVFLLLLTGPPEKPLGFEEQNEKEDEVDDELF